MQLALSSHPRSERLPHAMESLTAMIENGIVKGNGNSILPLAPLSRAESAVILYNMINK